MNKKKKIILITVVVVAWALIITGVVLEKMGKLSFFKDDESKATGNTTSQSEAEIKQKRKMPEKVNGVYLVAGLDFNTNPELAIDEIKASIDNALNDVQTYGFNTIYVSALFEKNPIIIGQEKDKLDVLKYMSQQAHKKDIYVVSTLTYNDAFSVGNSIKPNESLIKKLSSYDIDALMLTDIKGFDTTLLVGEQAEKSKAISSAIKVAGDIAKKGNKTIEFGVEVSPVWAHSTHEQTGSKTSSYYESLLDSQLDTKGWVVEGYVDFIYVDSDNSMSRANANYKTSMEWWNSVVEGTKVKLFAKHRVDLVCSDNYTWSNADELSKQFLAVLEQKNCFGSGFYNLSALKADKESSTTRFLSYLKGELDIKNVMTDLVITNQPKTTITTNESKISFTGNGDPTSPITMNGKVLERTDEGYFSIDVDLKAGKNIFTFANKGQKKIFTVNYVLDVITSIKPTDDVYGIGGTSIEIKAVAINGSNVYAVVNGQKVAMSVGSSDISEGDLANTDSFDYVTYSGTYRLPESKSTVQDLGRIKVYASYKGHSDSATGARVYVNKAYYEKLAVVTSTLAETFDSATLDGKYNPTFAPLPKGTYDYIDGEAVIDNTKFYKLSSGRLAYAKDFAYVENPPTLSSNNLTATGSVPTNKSTNLNIKTDWWVPFNVTYNPQSYYKGYDSRIFNVSSFTASYVDITFYHTNAASGNFDFSSSNVVKSAEWVNVGANDSATLRLYLRKAGAFYGYEVTHDEATGSFVISIKNKPSSLSNYTVLIDPGHGGNDPGAIGKIYTGNGQVVQYYESNVNLALAQLVRQKLQNLGVTVIMTRTGDSTFSLNGRAEYITSQKPDLSVSIHNDSSSSSTATGTSAYYFKPYSYPLAKEVHNKLLTAWNTVYGRPIKDRGTNFYPFRIARIEVCPAILIECGFMSNPDELTKLLDPNNQQLLSAAIADGIVSYINNY